MPWEFFLTESTSPSYVRRGDPLGFRAAADRWADILAPGLSNRTHDARWLTILSWILVQVRDARLAAGLGMETRTQAQRKEIYEWIRPLELMWVEQAARSVKDRKALDGRQLPGRNAVWRHAHGRSTTRFGMTDEQFERYRFTGPHGAYRTLLSTLEGLSEGHVPFCPGPSAVRLSGLLRQPLGRAARIPVRATSALELFWARTFAGHEKPVRASHKWLPLARSSSGALPKAEREILRPLLFGDDEDGRIRQRVARVAARSTAKTHAELVADVVRSLPESQARRLRALPPFTTLADAGVDAMLAVWRVLRAKRVTRVELDTFLGDSPCRRAVDTLRHEAAAWRRSTKADTDALLAPVHEFAEQLGKLGTRGDVLRVLASHHLLHGGGRRWFRLQGDAIIPDVGLSGQDAALYRFRLWPLSRLAVQLGVITQVPVALRRRASEAESDEEGDVA